jgi:hypothetical protein
MVKAWFEIESVLKVSVRRGAEGGYRIKFDPKPPLDRIYFLTRTAQLILLQQLDKMVHFQDLETGQDSQMKLEDFVRHVQVGAWILRAAPERSLAQ